MVETMRIDLVEEGISQNAVQRRIHFLPVFVLLDEFIWVVVLIVGIIVIVVPLVAVEVIIGIAVAVLGTEQDTNTKETTIKQADGALIALLNLFSPLNKIS